MPTRKSIGDYIPARGEARVLAELKGSYGGKRMTRYGRRGGFRSRFADSKRRERFWYRTISQAWEQDIALGPAQIANLAVTSISSDIPDQTKKLLMFDGFILARLNPDAGLDPEDHFQSTRARALLWYWWKQLRTDGNASGPTTAEMDPRPITAQGGNLQQILYRKDILSWGVVPIALQGAALASSTYPYYPTPVNMRDMPFARIPMPRLPRGGLVLTVERPLVCYAGVTTHDMVLNYEDLTWPNENPLLPETFQCWRALLAGG